ncbi:FAD-binding domain-containing protein [Mycena sanguinolenta]|uniref:FAD-binding domain-containing protein n=1 Tax=Mycena sanguinolenta TaxID=230812 RepID=A0A8H6ZL47_9AGAR|nr:FAD-binding domain-containing protein [Mycena sanguinolenta]
MKFPACSLQVVPLLFTLALAHSQEGASKATCRNVPGSPGYPSAAKWDALNVTLSGRLVTVVPSAKFCTTLPGGACTDDQWGSALFRSTIAGAMDQVNWEQDYDLHPPSLCLRNGTTCGQGNVPIYAVEAETVADIQAAVKFSSAHNLRVAVKSSGHDLLGRSTAPSSLLIHTHKFQNISFVGSTMTVGSGVYAKTVYGQGKANGKIAVGAVAATVCLGGGWVQGAGHSALSPALGLGADNALEFEIVVASGELLKCSTLSVAEAPAAGGVIVSVTFHVYPTFNATSTTLHAQHVFDWDSVNAGHYMTVTGNISTNASSMALLAPFLNASLALPGVSLLSQDFTYGDINDALFQDDDSVGFNVVYGSRLIPTAIYRDSPSAVGEVYKKLLESGTTEILGAMVVGGKVAENAHISSAVHPAWRTAKMHLLTVGTWDDSASLAEIDQIRHLFQKVQLPIIEEIAGPNAGAYSNEADVLEPNFQTTFFGPNYGKLSAIKSKYDPNDLFIVGAGVGSERWDEWGLCRV